MNPNRGRYALDFCFLQNKQLQQRHKHVQNIFFILFSFHQTSISIPSRYPIFQTMSATLVDFANLSTENLAWSKQGMIMGMPKLAYFHFNEKNFYLKAPNQRIAYTPKPLQPISNNDASASSSPRTKLPKFTLPVVCENDEFRGVLAKLEVRIVQLLFERKDMLFGENAKKIKNVKTLEEHYYKSFLYEGGLGSDQQRSPLLNAKLPLDYKTPSKFAVRMHHLVEDKESGTHSVAQVELTQDNFAEYIKGGNTAELVLRFKGVAVANSKAYPMIDVTHMVLREKEQGGEATDEGLYAKEELPDDFLLCCMPTLKRQTNDAPETPQDNKRSRKA